MKKSFALLLMCFFWMSMLLPGAVSAKVDLVSRYIWRGFDLLPDNHAAVQPSLTVDLGNSGFSLNVWSSFALSNRALFKYTDEIDLTLAYAFKMPENWEFSVGFTNYGYWFADGFTFKDHTTQEVFVSLSKTDLPLSPTLTVFYDFNLGSGLYASFSCSHSVKLNETASIDAGGLIGFNSKQFITKSGFSDIDFYLMVPLAFGKLQVIPSINLMIPLMNEVNDHTEIWFGLSIGL